MLLLMVFTWRLRLDNYEVKQPSGTVHLGICIHGSQYGGGMALFKNQVGINNTIELGVIKTDVQIPEETWIYIEMFFMLSKTNGSASNKVWVDGVLTIDNTTANLFSDFTAPWSFCRYGIVAINPSIQTSALSMYIDNIYAFMFQQVIV